MTICKMKNVQNQFSKCLKNQIFQDRNKKRVKQSIIEISFSSLVFHLLFMTCIKQTLKMLYTCFFLPMHQLCLKEIKPLPRKGMMSSFEEPETPFQRNNFNLSKNIIQKDWQEWKRVGTEGTMSTYMFLQECLHHRK